MGRSGDRRKAEIERASVRLVYFTAVDLSRADNGGGICCRNHVRRLAADPSVDLTVVATGPSESEQGVRAFLAGERIEHHYLPWAKASVSRRSMLRTGLRRFGWPLELAALENPHVDEALPAIIRGVRPTAVLVDYLPTFRFCPSLFQLGLPVVAITLNRETDMQRDLLRRGFLAQSGWLAEANLGRLEIFERLTHRRCAAVIAIGPRDVPRDLPRSIQTPVILPYLDAAPAPWQGAESRRIFFVGNEAHYPNRLAVEWLLTRLSPALASLDPTIGLDIVGSAPDRVSRCANVRLLGTSNAAVVATLFRSSAALVCPLENDFGSKFKVVEAVASATPIIATREALSGAPFLDVQTIHIHNPNAAASYIAQLLSDRTSLQALSQRIAADAARFRASQAGVWSRTLADVVDGRRHRARQALRNANQPNV